MKNFRVWLVVLAISVLSGCGYNEMQRQDEAVKAAWAEVLLQYQRRADLIPNIVSTVKAEADFEQSTLTRVIEARARATAVPVSPEMSKDAEAFSQFNRAQGELSFALSRLLAVVENYPVLKANAAFQDLRTQLEGTENRIGIARKRYIDAVANYNTLVRQFPQNLTAMLFGYKERMQYTVESEAAVKKAPVVEFDKKGEAKDAPKPDAPRPVEPPPAAEAPK